MKLSLYPRLAAGGSAYHNKITACVIIHILTAFTAVNIAVAYDGYLQSLLYFGYYIKVGCSAVHLGSCPAVNGYRRCTAFLCGECRLYCIDIVIVPAFSYL